MQRVSCDEAGLERASEVVSSGGVVVYPTDTVYGIGCDPYNADAVKKVYDIKGRDYGTPVPVLAGSIRDIQRIAHIDEASRRIASSLWPGRVTLILRLADSEIKESLMLDSDKIAVRIPGGACICDLLKRCGLIVGTSANRSGTGPFTEADACYDGITGFDLFLDGGLIRDGGASTIAECADGRLHIHREGSVGRASLEALL